MNKSIGALAGVSKKSIYCVITASLALASFACKPPQVADSDGQSGLASGVDFLVPDEVKTSLGSDGVAQLRIFGRNGAISSDSGYDRLFSSPISFQGGGSGGSVSFARDSKGVDMKSGETLVGVWLYILNGSNKIIYKGKVTPSTIALKAGTVNVDATLECEATDICGQDVYQVVGISGDLQSVSTAAVNLKVRVTVANDSGSESKGREALRGCISEVKKIGCSNGKLEQSKCQKLHDLESSSVAGMKYKNGTIGSYNPLGSYSVVDYLGMCEELGIVKKK